MTVRNDSGGDDRDAADRVALELLVLDRLVYRNRSQHRSGKYFTLIVEVRRACNTFAAPKLPDLLAQGLGLIASVPDSRNGRAREAWIRSAAAELSRMRVAAIACAYSLQSIVKASKHLAHQVSQTYFMALSTVFLACLARLFACNVHLGGRLLQVHAALLRTLLAQPCISECLPASDMADCRVPGDTVCLLSRLRGSGGVHKAARSKNTQGSDSSAAAASAATSALRGSKHTTLPPALLPATPKSSSREQRGEVGTSIHQDEEEEDDTGEHIGRAPMATEVEAGELVETDQAVARPAESNAAQGTKMPGRVAAEGHGGGVGLTRVTVGRGAGDGGSASGARREGGGSGGSGGGAGKKSVVPAHKKVVLASEFSDSSSEDEDDTDREPTAAAVGGGGSSSSSNSNNSSGERAREGPPQPQRQPDETTTAVSGASSERPLRHRPSLFFSSTPRGPQEPRTKPDYSRTTHPNAAATAASPASSSGVDVDGREEVPASASPATTAGETPKHAEVVPTPVPGQAGRVGWMIDPTPRPSPAPAVDAPSSSGRRRKDKKSKNGRRRGSGDGQAGAASAGAVAAGQEAKATDDAFRAGAPPSASVTPEVAEPTGGGTSAAFDAGEAGAPAAPGGWGDGIGGGSVAPDAGIDALPSAKAPSRKGRGRLEGAKARRRSPSSATNLGSGSPGGAGEQAQEPRGTGLVEPPAGDDVPSTVGGHPDSPEKNVKDGGGGVAGLKRGSFGRGLEEKCRKSKKQKTKKKKGGRGPSPPLPGGNGKRSSGGRDAIDDIFGSLL